MENIQNYIENKTKIYSLEHGVGEIVGVLKLYDGINDYIEVKFNNFEYDIKIYSENSLRDLRISSNPIMMTGLLKKLNAEINTPSKTDFSYSLCRIDQKLDLDSIINMIAKLAKQSNLKKSDRSLFRKCMKSLILEVGHVFKINEKHANNIVTDYMRLAS